MKERNKQRDDATPISHRTNKTTTKCTAHAKCPQGSAPAAFIGFLGEDFVPLLFPATCELQQQRCVKRHPCNVQILRFSTLAESAGHVDRVPLQPKVH